MNREEGKTPLSARGALFLRWSLGGLGILTLPGCLLWIRAHPLLAGDAVPLTFAGLGLGLLALSTAWRRFPIGVGLTLGSTLTSGLIALSVLTLLEIDPYRVFHASWLRLFPIEVGIWRFDERLGFANKPGTQGRDKKATFDVLYTIDDHGCRVTPDPKESKGDILCLGCSFTFGLGVEDKDTFPYLLGERYWPEYKVHNLSTTGWGTSHAYINLLDWLEKEPLPKLVFYGWISYHKTRNYIRADWVKQLGRVWYPYEKGFRTEDLRRHPHFEIEKGKLVFKGTVGAEDLGEDPPNLLEKEILMTQTVLREMGAACRDKEVPFIFLNLPVMGGESDLVPDFVSEVLVAEEIPLLDARSAYRGVVEDGHPNAETYEALADLIASATVLTEALGR